VAASQGLSAWLREKTGPESERPIREHVTADITHEALTAAVTMLSSPIPTCALPVMSWTTTFPVVGSTYVAALPSRPWTMIVFPYGYVPAPEKILESRPAADWPLPKGPQNHAVSHMRYPESRTIRCANALLALAGGPSNA
jgi:hypothetical protein